MIVLNENDLKFLSDRKSDGNYLHHGPVVWDVWEKINNIFLEKRGYIPHGGSGPYGRGKLLYEMGYKEKRDSRPSANLFADYDEDMVHCNWCEFLGLEAIHPLSWITEHSGWNGSCKYMRRYRNSLRTKEEMNTSYSARFIENILKVFREDMLNETILTEGELNKKCLEKHNHKCFKCGSLEDLAIDHVLPLSWFWAKSLRNIVPLCKSCNSSKGAKWPSEFYNKEELRRLSKVTGYSLIKLENPTYNYVFVDWVKDNINVVLEIADRRKKGEWYWYCFQKKLEISEKKRTNDFPIV